MICTSRLYQRDIQFRMTPRATTMSDSTRVSDHSFHVSGGAGFARVGAMCKQILNNLAAMADRSAERARFAALPLRQLEDIGMTIAERDALLR
jgi:hypothetical protein